MSKSRTPDEIRADALKRARILAHLIEKKISAWLAWTVYPPQYDGQMPDYESKIREQLIELVTVFDKASKQ